MIEVRRVARQARIDPKAFRRIADHRAYAAIAVDYAVILAAATLAVGIDSLPTTLLAIIFIAGRQSALQGLVHSASHYTLFSRRSRNDSLQFLYAYPILDSVPLYREQHLEHHRDFERMTPDRFSYLHDTLKLSKRGWWARTWLVFVKPLLGHAAFTFLADLAASYRDRDNRADALKLLIYWTMLLGLAVWFGLLKYFCLFWILPLIWLYPVFDIWSELSDHLDARMDSRNQRGVFYSVFLKGHELYHAVHHLYPKVPFYRLREMNHVLERRGVVLETSRGITDFIRIVYGGPPNLSSRETAAPPEFESRAEGYVTRRG